ncbi:TMV resistance protein N-like [Abrus precatorius]|uniref:TMV resistance protein N-like n=1 Tax=Abrus precatorius TaxID=3816 RepID=A0A8B8JU45_ABRPR|nr:TMV resistance protein N-like [Abrus precatorius]
MYEVFLSFRGEDTRASFISHLYASFQNAGINVFKDDDSLRKGDQISSSLLRAIEQSEISIIVFSKNYADSRWCLQELEQIMVCHRTISRVVLPVFYDVDPSEVRHQTGEFGSAFQNLLNRISVGEEKEKSWRRALREAGSISGFVVLNSRNESEDIKNIVEHVAHLVDKTELFVANHPVGIESRLKVVIELLNNQQSKDVLFLGIWGMGGLGKTTIAKAIYNQIGRNFEGKSFLLNIREIWEQNTNRVSLQRQILSDICKSTASKLLDIESGKNILKERLAQKKVLLILDDVNKLDQLNALCGSWEWFGSGSRIIITTRDEHLLKVHGVDHIHRMEEMNETESLEHFSWHAFKKASPKNDFVELSRNVVIYSGGLPLALEVLGSYLFDRGITEWKSVLDKLKKIPNNEVQKKLRISFDCLNDDREKEIFLDIACFFIGMNRNDVIQILNGWGCFPEIGISVLVERSLVTIDNKNKLGMHDLLRDMGREIIREKSPDDPEERSRLWLSEEVIDGTKAIKGLTLKLPEKNTICLKTKAFKKINSLRLLQLSGVQLDGDFKYLSGDLRLLCWHNFPLSCMPAEFRQRSLVAIELKHSNLKQMWEKAQVLVNLKILNLSHSHDLTKTPNFSYLPNLEKLLLKDCPSLSAISHTIGYLNKLLLLNLKACTGLQKLPRSIYKLKSLETLILSGCSKIDKLEEDLEQMKSLTILIADNTAIMKVPFSIIRSKSIGYISLCGFEGFSRDIFPSLIWSWMSPTNILSSLIQSNTSMSSRAFLDGPDSSFYSVSSILKDIPKLRSLYVVCDSEFQLNQDVGRILDILKGTNHKKLEASVFMSQISDVKSSPLVDCHGQIHVLESKNFLKSLLIQIGAKGQMLNILKESILQATHGIGDFLSFPGDNYFDWLTFHCKGSSVIFEVPHMNGHNLRSMMLSIVYYSPDDIISEGCQNVLINNYTKRTILVYKRDTLTSFEDEDWQSITSNLEPGNKVEVIVVFGHGFFVKNTTIYLLYDKQVDEAMEHCYAVDRDDIVSGHETLGRLFTLPSLVRAILISRPIWIGLVVILIWLSCRHSNKRRSGSLITRYILKGKWLVDYIQKFLAFKKAKEARSVITNASSGRVWLRS